MLQLFACVLVETCSHILLHYLTSGPLLALALARDDAISGWRDMLGPKDIKEAQEQAPNRWDLISDSSESSNSSSLIIAGLVVVVFQFTCSVLHIWWFCEPSPWFRLCRGCPKWTEFLLPYATNGGHGETWGIWKQRYVLDAPWPNVQFIVKIRLQSRHIFHLVPQTILWTGSRKLASILLPGKRQISLQKLLSNSTEVSRVKSSMGI